MVNAERVWQVIERIERVEGAPGRSDGNHNSWDQRAWARLENGMTTISPFDLISFHGGVVACGTAMCAAGWTIVEFPQEALAACRQVEATTPEDVTIQNVAGRVLELSYSEDVAFFSSANTLEQLVALAIEWCGPRPAPGDAVHQ